MKKEYYYTIETIRQKSCEMLEEIEEIRSKHRLILEPKNSALLVLDMQRYFLEDSSHAFIPAARAIIPGIRNLIVSYFQTRLPILFTRHSNSDADAKLMSKWWQDLIRRGPASEIIPELDVSKGVLIAKNKYDAFY